MATSAKVVQETAFRPFHVNVPEAELTELRRRIATHRLRFGSEGQPKVHYRLRRLGLQRQSRWVEPEDVAVCAKDGKREWVKDNYCEKRGRKRLRADPK